MTNTGLKRLGDEGFERLRGRNVGLLVNQASIDQHFNHAIDLFMDAHVRGRLNLAALFGPQHGLWGHTQDNMIEWEGAGNLQGAQVYSLYGEHRKPTAASLAGLDVLAVDLQDVGAKYYTFIWSMALCMEACQEHDIELLVLDRPNPLGGIAIEGPAANDAYRSFVGLHPLAIRHGMTIGEVALHLAQHHYPDCNTSVVLLQGWERAFQFEETGLPWGMPSPNMPTVQTARVYPGMCLLEATNISEGRGTTRPFEIFGAPWIDGIALGRALNSLELPGVRFRYIEFQPTFHKHQSELCRGCFIHVTDRHTFKPFLTGVAVISELYSQNPDRFAWKPPPYEYEYEKMPFDILTGNGWLRPMIESGASLSEMEDAWQPESREFSQLRESALLYPD